MVRSVVCACVVAMLTANARASEQAHSVGLYPATGGSSLAMFESKLELVVRGPIVEAVITQRFQNPSDRVTEATYIFPLPLDGAVTAMAIKTGSRTIHAAIETREAAQRRYEAAIAAGVSAARLDQERPDVFTQTVAAIPPHGTVEITLRVDTVARYRAGTWELALPLVVAPRYVPGTASGRPTTGTGRSPDTDRATDASRVTPSAGPGAGGATSVTMHFADPPHDVTSPTHQLVVSGSDVSFVDPHSDHDAIVRWRTGTPAAGWVEQGSDGGFAAVLVESSPPAVTRHALRCMLVLDRAATMRGDAERTEHPFVRALMAGLGAADRIAVIGSDHVAWSAPADALRAVDQMWPLKTARFDLTRVLQTARSEHAPLVLVTDGLVADDRPAIEAARKLGVPIHVIGVGPAPARGLLTQIAAVTGGTVRFAVPGDELDVLAADVIADLVSPPAAVTVSWGDLAASEVVPAILPRLGAHQAMLVLARVRRAQAANGRAAGELFAIETVSPTGVPDGALTRHGSLARRWAKNRLDELLGPHTASAEVTAHAIAFGLVSPYTSLVAIGTDVVIDGGVRHSVSVPVSVPAGMQWDEVKEETSVDTLGRDGDLTRSKKKSAPEHDGYSKDDEDADAGREIAAARPEPRSVADLQPSDIEIESTRTAFGSGGPRLSLGAGGGLAIDHGSNGLLAITGRIEVGGRTEVGAEASLWLVAGLHGEGRMLLTLGRRGIAGRLGLGLGAGLQFGTATGVATALRLHLPVSRHMGGYLRYDNALLFRTPIEAEHVLTLGADWTF